MAYFTPSSFLTRLPSAGATSYSLRKPRLRFDDFFCRLWLFIAWRRISFPAALTLNRFFAPLDVFTFGIWLHSCVLRGAEQHDHVASVLEWRLLDQPELLDVVGETEQEVVTPLRVQVLTPPEHDRHLHLRPLVQEADDVTLLRLVVVDTDLGPELDLLDEDLRLMLPRELRLLLLLVAVLPVVHDAGDGRVGV